MANFVTNRIRLIGNEAIQQLSEEINKRFNDDIRSHSSLDTESVGRVLYGYDGDGASLSKELDAKWVHPDGPYNPWEPLRLISGWKPVTEIQDHILWYASKLDPKLIVVMAYEDEMPNFVGARYTLMDNGKIQEFESRIDTTHLGIVSLDEIQEFSEKNKITNEFEKIISYEEFRDIAYQQQIDAFQSMRKKYKWVIDPQV